MDDYPISDYLEKFIKQSGRGTCKSCQKSVQWSKVALGQHKRASCDTASDDEKRRFAKRLSAGSRTRPPIFEESALASGNDYKEIV